MNDTVRKILILDDDDMVRESLVAFFEDRDWRVISSDSGEDAIQLISKERPDCAIVDIRLPGMDGNTFIRNAIEEGQLFPCVICTGSPEYHIPDDIMLVPTVCDYVFTKPIADMSQLEAALIHMLSKANVKE